MFWLKNLYSNTHPLIRGEKNKFPKPVITEPTLGGRTIMSDFSLLHSSHSRILNRELNCSVELASKTAKV